MAVWAIALNENFTEVSDAVFGFLTEDFGWLYLVAMASIVKAMAHDKDTPNVGDPDFEEETPVSPS